MPAINTQPLLEVEFRKGSQATNPIPPPGKDYDGQVSETLSAMYPQTQQVTTVTLGATVAVDDVITLVITPINTATGTAWADNLGPVTIKFTATTTDLDDAAAGLVAAAAAAQTVVSESDLANFQRLTDFVLVTKGAADAFVLTATQFGADFSYTLTSTGATTHSAVTTGASDEFIPVGFVIMKDGYTSNDYPNARLPKVGDTAADILGVVMDSNFVRPLVAGQKRRGYQRNSMLVYRPWGTGTADSEIALAVDDALLVRLVAGAGENELPGIITNVVDGGNTLAIPGAKSLRTTPGAGTSAYALPHPNP